MLNININKIKMTIVLVYSIKYDKWYIIRNYGCFEHSYDPNNSDYFIALFP
jgi:hypothetical protein